MKTLPFRSSRGCLSYVLIDPTSKEAAVIDPSEEINLETYTQALQEHDATLAYILETHTHADHISSAPALASLAGAKIVRHAHAPSPHKDITVTGGEKLPLGTTELSIMATPGHTDESISILIDGMVFTGDALLIGGTGRTDFQAGSSEDLYESLHSKLGKLPDETVVYPAHDYQNRTSSTIGAEKTANPRFVLTHDQFVSTMNAHHPPTPELFETAVSINSSR